MEEEYDISPAFKKSKKPSVPEGFFERFYAGVKDEIDALDAFAHLSIRKRTKPKAGMIQVQVPGVLPARKKTRVLSISIWSGIAAVAASLTLFFYISLGDEGSAGAPQSQLVSANTSSKPLENEMMEAYVAYLDEEELVDFIVENNISTSDDLSDDIYDWVESDIEDIYLDL
jgi:hypothetical protein